MKSDGNNSLKNQGVILDAYNLAVVSDLHLSEGFTRSHLDRFGYDEGFVTWLEYLDERRRVLGRPWLLIVNGDFFEFDRVVSWPQDGQMEEWKRELEALGHTPEDCSFNLSWEERYFGLRHEAHKAVWKLLAIHQAHRAIFKSLWKLIRDGNRLVLVIGNHDAELQWPLVQEAVRRLLEVDGPNAPWNGARFPREGVEFCEGPCVIDGLVFIEHGHTSDPWSNSLSGVTTNGHWRPFIGSMISRYVLIPLARKAPRVFTTGARLACLYTVGYSKGYLFKHAERLHAAYQDDSKGNPEGPRYFIFGHTHVPEVKALGKDSWYINTGAWASAEDKMNGRVEQKTLFPFVELIQQREGEFCMEFLWWNARERRAQRGWDGAPEGR